MNEIQITYKSKSYKGHFKIRENFVTAYYNGKKTGAYALGNPENITAQKLLENSFWKI